MNNKFKILIGVIVAVLVIGGIAALNISGENFLGMVRYEDPIISSYDAFNIKELSPVSESTLANQLTSKNFKNVEFQTSWAPSRYREETNKALIKIYPFSTVKYAKDVKDILFESFKNWRQAGVKGVGVVVSVDYSKQDTNHLLMGTETSGIYRSNDFGQSWTKLDNFPTNIVNRVAIDPNNHNHYLAIADWVYLYESFDKGTSWQLNTVIDTLSTGEQDLQWNGNVIFIRVGENAKVSQNNGQNWSSHILPFGSTGYVRIKGNGYGGAVAAINTDPFADYNFYTTDNYGITWTQKLTSVGDDKISAFDISADGQNIVVARYNGVAKEVSFAKSSNGGNSWSYVTPPNQGYTTFWPQDVLLDEDNPDEFYVFIYMKMGAVFVTYDGGQTLLSGAYTIDEYDAIPYKMTNTEDAMLITPMDLRFSHMVKITKEIPLEMIDLGDLTKTDLVNVQDLKESINVQPVETSVESDFGLQSIEQVKPITKKLTYLLLPTDQGLFLYDEQNKKMSTLVKDLYLGDTGYITLTSCPRLYAGLWHVGYFFVDSNGVVRLYSNSEKGGATAGEDNGCNTSIMYSQGMYMPDGVNADMDVSYWIWNSLEIGQVGSTLFKYHDGWWYVRKGQGLVRLDIVNRQIEYLQMPNFDQFMAFSIEESNPVNYWMLTKTGIDIQLWKSQDLQNWTLFKQLDNLDYFLYRETLNVNGETSDKTSIFRANLMIVEGSQILLGDAFSVAVSNDYGSTWNQNFYYANSSNIVKDEKGRLFVGLRPQRTIAQFINGKQVTGVWYSIDHGATWQLLEQDTAKSHIESLALDETRNILYAGTHNQSILEFNLNSYNLPEPTRIFKKEIELNPQLIDIKEL